MQQHEHQNRGRQLSGPRPGEFPIGSELSRAPARAMLDARAAVSQQEQQLVLVTRMDRELALDGDACVQILRECGFMPAGPIGVVRFDKIPDGLNAEETEKFLTEKGKEICSPSGEATTVVYQKAL